MGPPLERKKIPPLNLNPKASEESEIDSRLDSILRGMGDSERLHQKAPSNLEKPSSASRRYVTPGLDDEKEILSRMDSILRSAEGSGRSTPAVTDRTQPASSRSSVRQTPEVPEWPEMQESHFNNALYGDGGSGTSTPLASDRGEIWPVSGVTQTPEPAEMNYPSARSDARPDSLLRKPEGSGRSTPATDRAKPRMDSSVRQTPEPSEMDYPSAKSTARLDNLVQKPEGSGRSTPATDRAKPQTESSSRQTPEPAKGQLPKERGNARLDSSARGWEGSGRSTPATADRAAAASGRSSARQTPDLKAAYETEAVFSRIDSIVRSVEDDSRSHDSAQRVASSRGFNEAKMKARVESLVRSPEGGPNSIEQSPVSTQRSTVGGRTQETRQEAEFVLEVEDGVDSPEWNEGSKANNRPQERTPVTSGRATATPRSHSPGRLPVTSADAHEASEVMSRLDSIVRSVTGGSEKSSAVTARGPSQDDSSRADLSRIDSARSDTPRADSSRAGSRQAASVVHEELSHLINSLDEDAHRVEKAPAGGNRPASASRRQTPQPSARSEMTPQRSSPRFQDVEPRLTPPTSANGRKTEVLPQHESPAPRSETPPRRPSGALGNHSSTEDYADDFEDGPGEAQSDSEEIVEDDGPETPEDQGTPRVLNRSVQEIPRESADRGAGQEANLPVRNFGPRPASAYGPRGSAPSAGGFARREVNWGETPGEASTSGSPNNQGGLPKAGNGGGGSGFANGFDNRPWSAGSAPGTGLHSGALDGDFDRRSVDLGPVRLAKTGSFGSRGGSKGSGMSKEEFRVHFENAEPADSEPSFSHASSSPPRTRGSSSRPTSAGVGHRAREIARTLELHPTQWGVGDVCNWVEHVGHAQHRVRFAHHRIDGPLLLRLAEEQLKVDLDIRSLGQRQSLATEIGALREQLGMASQRRTSGSQRPASAPRMRGNDVMLSSATLRDEERRAKLARELEKAMTRATKARMKAEVLTYTVGQAETEVDRLQAELAELDRREHRRMSAAAKEMPLWRPPGEITGSLGGASITGDSGQWFKPHINPKSLEMLQSTEGSADFLQRMSSDLNQRAQKIKEKRQEIVVGWKGGYEFVEQQKHKTERFLREVLQQKLDLSVEELTDAVVDKLLDEQGGALDLTDEQQENLAKAKGSKRRSLLEQYLRGNEFMSRLENDQRRRDASLREYRQHLEMIDTISRNGKTRTQREQEDRQAAIAHFQELWAGWEMPSGSGKSPSGTGKAEEGDDSEASTNSMLDSLLDQAVAQKQQLSKYALVQQNEARRGLGLVPFEGEPIESRQTSSMGQYGASGPRASHSVGARPQTAHSGGQSQERGKRDGKVPIMQETLWMISRLKPDEIQRLKHARGEKKVLAVFRAFRAQQFVRKMELDKEIRDFKLEQKLSELRRRPKSAGNAREFMMRLEDDLLRRKEKEQALLKQRILMEGQPIIAPPGKATWRN